MPLGGKLVAFSDLADWEVGDLFVIFKGSRIVCDGDSQTRSMRYVDCYAMGFLS